MDRKKDTPVFLTALGGLAEVFDKKMTTILNEVYFKALEKYPISVIQKAFDKAIEKVLKSAERAQKAIERVKKTPDHYV